MIFDPEIYCTAAETAELDGTAPLALAGDGLWVGVLSRGACLLDGVDRPGQSGDILLGPAPLVLTPQSDCHLLAVRLTGHCTDAYLLQLGAARWADGAACPGAAELIAARDGQAPFQIARRKHRRHPVADCIQVAADFGYEIAHEIQGVGHREQHQRMVQGRQNRPWLSWLPKTGEVRRWHPPSKSWRSP